jgi:hypothetical protein
MKIALHRRTEVALRSLPLADQKAVVKSLEYLQHSSLSSLIHSGKVAKLSGSAAGLYYYRATHRLRILFLIHKDEYVVEDIVDHDHFERLLRRRGA